MRRRVLPAVSPEQRRALDLLCGLAPGEWSAGWMGLGMYHGGRSFAGPTMERLRREGLVERRTERRGRALFDWHWRATEWGREVALRLAEADARRWRRRALLRERRARGE